MHALGVRSFFIFNISLSTLFLGAALSIDKASVFAFACSSARFCRSPLRNPLGSKFLGLPFSDSHDAVIVHRAWLVALCTCLGC